MSAFDNCLFFRITATETIYIIVYVDDTFVFSNSQEGIDAVRTSLNTTKSHWTATPPAQPHSQPRWHGHHQPT